MNYRKHFAAVTGLIILVTAIVLALLLAIYKLPLAASAEAGPIDTMMRAHFVLIAFLWSLVVVFVIYALVVFRRRPEDTDESEGDPFHGHTGLEIAWTILPLALVVVFGVWGAQVLSDITRPEPQREMVVEVIGQQWSWSFVYPELDDLRTSELVLPVNQKVRLELTSLDVLHSFWVPEFRVKQDLVPGQLNFLRVTPTVEGDYKLLCAEICGLQHHSMRAPVRVLSEAEFDTWAEEQTAGGAGDVLSLSPEERGQRWAQQFGCNSCHSTDGTVVVGPSWLGLVGSTREFEDGGSTVADEEYIIESILEPNVHIVEGFPAAMPDTFEEQFATEEEKYNGEISIVEDLFAYMATLSE